MLNVTQSSTIVKRYYTPDETAEMIGVSRSAVYRLLRNGIIPSIRIGKRFVLPCAAVDKWFDSAGKSVQ
jgi:excisionase family DNA binding protein